MHHSCAAVSLGRVVVSLQQRKWYNHSHCFVRQNAVYQRLLFLSFQLDGATYHAKQDTSAGGVARNIAEGIYKIYGNVNLISAVGNDQVSSVSGGNHWLSDTSFHTSGNSVSSKDIMLK